MCILYQTLFEFTVNVQNCDSSKCHYKIAKLFAIENCSQFWKSNQTKIKMQKKFVSFKIKFERNIQIALNNENQKTQKIYRICVKMLESNCLTNLKSFIENFEASVMPFFRKHLMTKIFSITLCNSAVKKNIVFHSIEYVI